MLLLSLFFPSKKKSLFLLSKIKQSGSIILILVTRERSNCLVHNKIVLKHRKLAVGHFLFVLVFVILVYV